MASIREQSRLPDELVACDDCSTDNTIEILQEFARSVAFPVRIVRNPRNLGFVANFERAIRMCEGDLIVLSDQDDVWYSLRLERSHREFIEHPEVGLVFSDADVIDDQDRPTGVRLWQNFGFSPELEQRMIYRDYTVLVKRRFVTGATMMFRSQLRENCLPFGPGWLHDEWIAPTAAAVADVRPIDIPLIRYRAHTSQQVGLSPAPGFHEKNQKHWTELARQVGLLEGMRSHLSKQPLTSRGRMLLSCYEDHLRFARFRYALPKPRLMRLPAMLKETTAYQALGSGFFSMLTDLILTR